MSLESFYTAISVPPYPGGDDPVMVLSRPDTEFPSYTGYIKFQTCAPEPATSAVDNSQADQFEAWLRERGFAYFRGYPDEPESHGDRRFFVDEQCRLELLRLARHHKVPGEEDIW